MKNKISYIVLGSALLGFLAVGSTVFAAGYGFGRGVGTVGRTPGVFGTVSAINGSTLTVTSKGFGQNATTTTYTVNATNATVNKNGTSSSLSGITVGDTVSVQGTVSGTDITATTIRDGALARGGIGPKMNVSIQKPNVSGVVASVSGNTITMTSKMGRNKNATTTTYTVDATSATVTKNSTSSSVSSIAIGDTIMVKGTVSGTNITATTIRDGMPQKNSATPMIQGNGQPVIGGNVTAINGSVITVTNKSNVTYTVDATNATVEKGNATSSISAVTVGDNVIVQGTVNGSSITASSIIDSGTNTASVNPEDTNSNKTHQGGIGGFFNNIGSFFHNIFGFF